MLLEERIDELIEFNMVYGHSDVSEELMGGPPTYKSLGQWCDRIRHANKAGLVSKGNVQLLQNIGFHWGGESSRITISPVTLKSNKRSVPEAPVQEERPAVPVPVPPVPAAYSEIVRRRISIICPRPRERTAIIASPSSQNHHSWNPSSFYQPSANLIAAVQSSNLITAAVHTNPSTTTSTRTTIQPSPAPATNDPRSDKISSYGDHMEILVGRKIYDVIPVETMEVSTYTHLVLSHVEFCRLPPMQMIGKRKYMPLGFPGIRCQYCNEEDRLRSGSYFPSSLKTMSDSSKTLFAIDNHFQKCASCPIEVKDELIDAKNTHQHERRTKKRHGGQKAAFYKIWNVMHPDEGAVNKIARQIYLRNRFLRFGVGSIEKGTNVELDSRKMETTTSTQKNAKMTLASSQQERIVEATVPPKQHTDANLELNSPEQRMLETTTRRQQSTNIDIASSQNEILVEETTNIALASSQYELLEKEVTVPSKQYTADTNMELKWSEQEPRAETTMRKPQIACEHTIWPYKKSEEHIASSVSNKKLRI